MNSRSVLTAALLCCLAVACSKDNSAAPKPSRAFPVQIAKVAAQDVDYQLTAVGAVEAYEKVSVTSRVAGVIEKVLFTEGDTVQRGQVLAEIEIDRYLLAVRAAQAALKRAEAARDEAEAGLARRQDASGDTPGLIPGEELQQWKTRVSTLLAEMQERRVSLDQANLNLSQARVRAPSGGVMQTREIHTGQYAQAGTLLGHLLQRDPLLLRFRIPEADASNIDPNMTVQFTVRGVEGAGEARVIHVAMAAGEVSRMVEVAAKITPSKDHPFRPGAFAQVTIPVSTHESAPVIPGTAVRPSEHGFLAYVVKDGHAEERRLTLGMRTADGKIEIKDGIEAGEHVVIRGADALRNGVEVRIDKAAPVEVGQAETNP